MSLAIDVDLVEAVLLADGWHKVSADSFTLDSYEYIWWPNGRDARNQYGGDTDPTLLHGGGNSGVCATGFSFKDGDVAGRYLAGPLTAVLAVRYRTTT